MTRPGGAMRRIALSFLMMLLAVPAALAQSASYRIQPGDQLQITVLEDETLNRELLVTPDGQISVPLAGTVRVVRPDRRRRREDHRRPAGLELRGAAERLRGADLGRPDRRALHVFVLGQVNSPGPIEVEQGTTLLQALALAGGPARFAATKRIQLRRTDPSTGQEKLYLFNYNAVERGGIDHLDDRAARRRRDHRSRTPPLRVRRRRDATCLPGRPDPRRRRRGPRPPPRTWRSVSESTLTATISQSIEADTNYNLDAGLARAPPISATPASASA